jgi:hypothetical protein
MTTRNLVGIGTTDPQFTLDIAGDINVSGGLFSNGQDVSGALYWSETEAENIVTGVNVGIGVTGEPSDKLHVAGSLNLSTGSSFKINGTDVLTGSGLGTGVTGSSLTSVGTLSSLLVSGNVGVGTATATEKLQVVGNVLSTQQFLGQTTDSATAPSFSWSGDTNCGIFRPGADIIGFTTNGAEKARILSNGNVGIGITNPTEKLQVVGNLNLSTGSSFKINGADVLTGSGLGTGVTGSSLTSVGTLSSLLVSGNVGVGTATATEKLQVVGNILSTQQFLGQSTDSATAPSFSWSGDTNCGIFRPGTDIIGFTTNGTEKARILSNGNVGIGITNPTEKLQVVGNLNLSTGSSFKIDGTDVLTGSGLGSGVTGSSLTSVGTLSSLLVSGDVAIGTTSLSPLAKLSVFGNKPWVISETFYLVRDSSKGGTGQFGSQVFVFGSSIYADSWIWSTAGFIATSDRRIKKDIHLIDDGFALQKLRLIEPAEYRYVDEIQKGSKPVFGFIAQQVAEHFPEAVVIQKDFIPDIYHLQPIHLEEKIIEISGRARSGKLRLITLTRQMDLEVTALNEDVVSFEEGSLTSEDIQNGEVFVIGYEVDDLHTLKKDYLFTINFAATQELDRMVQNQKANIEDMKQVNDDLELQNINLKNRVSDLESQLSSLLTALTEKGIL